MHSSEDQQQPISNNLNAAPSNANVALLTILPESYEAVCRIFNLSQHERRKGYQWTWGNVNIRDNGSVVIVTGLPLDRENIAAATFATAMLDAWSPENLLLVDIGGAVKGRDDVRLGDVITHTIIHYYDYHKVSEIDGDSPRYLPLAGASTRLRELSRRPAQRGDNSWIGNIFVKRPGSGLPKVFPGEMLVGGAIQSNSSRLDRLLETYPKVIVVEMEGVGAGRAVLDRSIQGNVPEFLIIRGISDYCNVQQKHNQKTRDRWRQYAANAAAAHAHAIVYEMDSLPRKVDDQQAPPHCFTRLSQPIDNLWESSRTSLKGREKELQDIKQLFLREINKDQIFSPHVIWGEAGVGKSVLAREIAEQIAPNYMTRWWINASDELKIRSSLREFARRLGIPSASMNLSNSTHDDAEAHRFLRDLKEFLELDALNKRVLVILDNVDDAKLKHDLEVTTLRYLPPTVCDVLITSQSGRWHPIARTNTSLRGLSLEAGTSLIADESERSELVDNEDVRAICSEFAGRPLFLKQIASLLRDGDDPAHFRYLFSKSVEDALDFLPEFEGFDSIWRKTYTLSIERAENARPGCRNLLEIIAFLSPEPMPLDLLHATAELQKGWRTVHIDAALRTLTERSLLECQRYSDSKSHTYTMHRVIGALIRTIVRERGDGFNTLSSAMYAVSHKIPSRDVIRRPGQEQSMAGLAPHIEAITDYVMEYRETELPLQTIEQSAEAASMLGLYRRTLSEWTASVKSNQKAVDLSCTVRQPGSSALRKVRLANVVRQRAQFDLAQTLLNDALPQLKEYGDKHDYAWGLTVQARILRHRSDSDPQQALTILEEAMRLLKTVDPAKDPNMLRQVSELHGYISVVNRQLSNLDVAESESAKGLGIITSGMSPDEVFHATNLPDEPLLAMHLRALGGVWRLRGDLGRAMQAQKKALEILERIYGSNHIDICRALDSLGRVQREWGDFTGALESFIRAGEISDLQFGLNSPHAGTAAINRALTYLELKNPLEALEEAEKGFKVYCLAYNERFNNELNGALRNEATVWAIFVRANALANLEQLQQAHDYHTTVLNWRQAHYPPYHALTASSYYALGDVLWVMGTNDSRNSALNHHHQALVIRQQVFGTQPNYWLAQSQARLGTLTNNLELLRLAYDTYRMQLKPGHWRIQEVTAAIQKLVDLHE